MKHSLSHFLPLLLIALPLLSFAQEAAPAAAPVAESATSMTWSEIMDYGGIVLKVILGISILTLAYILWLFATVRTKAVVPSSLSQEVLDILHDGDLDKGLSLCQARPSAYSTLAQRAISFVRTTPHADPVLLREVISGEGTALATSILGLPARLSYAISIAPMLGLLGTVIGMLQSFISIAGDVAAAKPVQLAQGMSQAIITTVAGLIVAILASVFQAWFNYRAERAVATLSNAADSLFSTLLSRLESR